MCVTCALNCLSERILSVHAVLSSRIAYNAGFSEFVSSPSNLVSRPVELLFEHIARHGETHGPVKFVRPVEQIEKHTDLSVAEMNAPVLRPEIVYELYVIHQYLHD